MVNSRPSMASSRPDELQQLYQLLREDPARDAADERAANHYRLVQRRADRAHPEHGKMPSSKFTFPKNLDTITANQNFTLKMVLKNVDAGHFTNAKRTTSPRPSTQR
ncbi:hypothetical protein B0H13DRAFT_1161055 [Mycena leptocephala]|nr:hypothetical protein B0H13DRAFT_1161055 [Mycena leptocephala]